MVEMARVFQLADLSSTYLRHPPFIRVYPTSIALIISHILALSVNPIADPPPKFYINTPLNKQKTEKYRPDEGVLQI